MNVIFTQFGIPRIMAHNQPFHPIPHKSVSFISTSLPAPPREEHPVHHQWTVTHRYLHHLSSSHIPVHVLGIRPIPTHVSVPCAVSDTCQVQPRMHVPPRDATLLVDWHCEISRTDRQGIFVAADYVHIYI